MSEWHQTVLVSLKRLHLPLYASLQGETRCAALWTGRRSHKSCPRLRGKLSTDLLYASWLPSLKGHTKEKMCYVKYDRKCFTRANMEDITKTGWTQMCDNKLREQQVGLYRLCTQRLLHKLTKQHVFLQSQNAIRKTKGQILALVTLLDQFISSGLFFCPSRGGQRHKHNIQENIQECFS